MSKNLKKEKKLKSDIRGFALLFAVLASSVMLSIGIAIWNIAIREVIFSSFGRESQIALYAADTGAECALYWDIKNDSFSATTQSTINCGTNEYTVGGNSISNINDLKLGTGVNDSCVSITVTKNAQSGTTKVESFGHNNCDQNSTTRVERGISVEY